MVSLVSEQSWVALQFEPLMLEVDDSLLKAVHRTSQADFDHHNDRMVSNEDYVCISLGLTDTNT